MQLAALGGPAVVAPHWTLVDLAVADIGPGDQAVPEALDQALGRKIAPALVDVALVADLVEDHRLLPDAAEDLGAVSSITAEPFWMLAWLIHGRPLS
jgi:hypothetical protein